MNLDDLVIQEDIRPIARVCVGCATLKDGWMGGFHSCRACALIDEPCTEKVAQWGKTKVYKYIWSDDE